MLQRIRVAGNLFFGLTGNLDYLCVRPSDAKMSSRSPSAGEVRSADKIRRSPTGWRQIGILGSSP